MRYHKKIITGLTISVFLLSSTPAHATSELGQKIKAQMQLSQDQAQSQDQTQIVENNNTNNNENNNYIENSSNPEIFISNSSGSDSYSDSYIIPAVVYSEPQVVYADSSYPVEELPKTGLPALGWILASLLPAGLGLKKLQ